MARVASELVVRLVDMVTGPARAAAGAIKGLQGAATAKGPTFSEKLGIAMAANQKRLDAARMGMVDAAVAAYALKRALGTPINTAAEFEGALIQVKSLLGANVIDMRRLSDQAKMLGRTTSFSAGDAAKGMGFLAMAGFKTNQILGAMPGTIQIATAANMDLAQAADLVSNVLTGYGKDVKELGHVNDVLVKAFTSANTNLTQLGQAMKYAGPVASSAGVKFEQAAAALALMGNAGIQATMAGTSLRGAISRMLSPSNKMKAAMKEAGLNFKNAQGRLLPLNNIVKQLEKHSENTGLMMQLFGQRAGPAMMALVRQGSKGLEELQKKLEESGGTADRVAKAKLEGFEGRMRILKSALDGLALAIGTSLLPALTNVINAMTDMLGPVISLIEKYPTLAATLIGVTTALIGMRVAMAALKFGWLWSFGGALSATAMGTRAVTGAMAGLKLAALATVKPMMLVKGAVIALKYALIGSGIGIALIAIGAAGTFIYNNWVGIKKAVAAFGKAFSKAIGPVKPMLDPVIKLVSKLFNLFSSITGEIDPKKWEAWGKAAGTSVGNAIAAVGNFGKAVKEQVTTSLSAFNNLNKQFIKVGKDIINAILTGMKSAAVALINWVKSLGSRIGSAIASPVTGAINRIKSYIPGMGGKSKAAPIAGKRARGGPVSAGKNYIVGEKGPELFKANRSGNIVPNEKLGGTTVNFSPQFTFQGVGKTDIAEIEQRVRAVMRDEVKELFRGAYSDVGVRFA